MKKILILLAIPLLITPSVATIISLKNNQTNKISKNDEIKNDEQDNLEDETKIDEDESVNDYVNDYKVDLEQDLIIDKLGVINQNSERDILESLKYHNPKLSIDDLEVSRSGFDYAQIKPVANSRVYRNSSMGMIVNFEVKPKIQLNHLTLNLNLDKIESNKSKVILKYLKAENPTLDVEQLEVIELSIASESALVRAKFDGIYQGQFVVKYELLGKDLNDDAKNLNLGKIPNNKEKTVAKKLLRMNPNLKLYEIKIMNITLNSFEIQGINEGKYYSSKIKLQGTFSIPEHSIKNDLKGFNLNLGEIKNTSSDIINAELKKYAPMLNLKYVDIFNIDGKSLQIKAKFFEDVNGDIDAYYLLEEAVKISFTLPTRVSLTKTIPTFKLIKYRTRNELEKQIDQKIKLLTGKTNVKVNEDYEFSYWTKPNINDEVSIQTITVRALGTSAYLDGSFSFEIIDKLNLINNRDKGYTGPIRRNDSEEKQLLDNIKTNIRSEIQNQKIDESLIDVETALNKLKINTTSEVNGSVYYKYRHNYEYYYRTLKMNFLENDLFVSNIVIWSDIPAPIYNSSEIWGIYPDFNRVISWVDSQKDLDYPDKNTYYKNSEHNPEKYTWQYSKTLTIASIDFKQLFNYQNVNDFFKHYKLELHYNWGANSWTDDKWSWSYNGWRYSRTDQEQKAYDNKDLVNGKPKNEQHGITKEWVNYIVGDNIEYKEVNPDKLSVDKFTKHHGSLTSERKAVGAINFWLEQKDTSIIIKGQAISGYNWKSGGANHAAFGYFDARNIVIKSK